MRTQVTVLRQHDEETLRFGTDRAIRRLAELDAFREAGLWLVRVLVGAGSAGELARIGPVLAGSADLGHHPYRLGMCLDPQPLAEALAAKAGDPEAEAQVPFLATAGLLTALAGLPQREVPGLRVLDAGQFDVTSETGTAGMPGAGPAVSLGVILDAQDRAAGEFLVPLPTLNRHALVTGATGAGKSQTVRHLLTGLTRAGLPWLVIEPVKSEYPGMAGRLAGLGPAAEVTVLNPADPGAIPLSVNPLAPERGYPVQAHIDMVRALFLAAFDADEPFPQIIAQALQRVYEANGWDVVTGGTMAGAAAEPAVPSLAELQRAALEVIEDVGYGRELQADVRGFVDVRLRSLRIGSAGRFFEGGHPADIARLLRRNVVLCLEDVANDEDKAFLMGTLVIRVVEHLRLAARAGRPPGLRHVIVIEEAHRLLRARREGRASAHAVELFAAMLAEIRAYGEGLVIAEQIPAKLVADVVKNTALKVMHRLPAADDRDLAGAAMNLDDAQSRQVVSLEPGVAAVFADGMDRPIRVRVPFGGDASAPGPGPVPPLLSRRSTACGPVCTGERARAPRPRCAPPRCWPRPGHRPTPGCGCGCRRCCWPSSPTARRPAVPAALRGRWDELRRPAPRVPAGHRGRRGGGRPGAGTAAQLRSRAPGGEVRRGPHCAHSAAAPGRAPGPARTGSSPRCAGCTKLDRLCPAGGRARQIRAGARRRWTSTCPAWRTGREHGWGTGCGRCGGIRCPWNCPGTGWPPGPRCSARTTSAPSPRPGHPRRRAAPRRPARPRRRADGRHGLADRGAVLARPPPRAHNHPAAWFGGDAPAREPRIASSAMGKLPMRARLATTLGGAAGTMSRLAGRGDGSVIGGVIGLRLEPDLLALLSAGRQIVLVTGTNGKTTTTRLITAALGALGQDVASNAFGANMEAGLAAALGKAPDAPLAVLEVDERWLPAVIKETKPRVVTLLNLSRDQMDRAAEIWLVARRWREALAGREGLLGGRQRRRPADRLGCLQCRERHLGGRRPALARGLLVLRGVRVAPAAGRTRLALRRMRVPAAVHPVGA